MIRNLIRKNPFLIKSNHIHLNPKYDVIDKKVHGPKLISKKNESKLKMEKELQEALKPSVHTYKQDDKVLHEKKPEFSFKKEIRERMPSPDMKKPLHVNITTIKKRSASV